MIGLVPVSVLYTDPPLTPDPPGAYPLTLASIYRARLKLRTLRKLRTSKTYRDPYIASSAQYCRISKKKKIGEMGLLLPFHIKDNNYVSYICVLIAQFTFKFELLSVNFVLNQ